jgi:hypothetical protein
MIRRSSVAASPYACTERTIYQGVLSLNREIEHGGVGFISGKKKKKTELFSSV